ncbi:MAG: hypothetical protein R3C28_16940 [Pirellulaceae bacterium]
MIASISLGGYHWSSILLAVGTGGIFIALLTLVLSRWGEARPIFKCAVLSVVAHVLLAGYAVVTQVLHAPTQKGKTEVARVRLVEDDQGQENTNANSTLPPWDEPSALPPELVDASVAADVLPSEEADPEPPALQEDEILDILSQTEVTDSVAQFVPEIPPLEVPDVLSAERDDAVANASASSPDDDLPIARDAEHQLTQSADSRPRPRKSAVRPDDSRPRSSTAAATVTAKSERLMTNRRQLQMKPTAKYQARKPEKRQERVAQFGGNQDALTAVEGALAYLARVQDPHDGRWDASQLEAGRSSSASRTSVSNAGGLNADNAITGLALLAFLGSGHTHLDGPYAKHVQRGLEFLLATQSVSSDLRSHGNLSGGASEAAAMYCHGIATMALSEAYIMTRDRRIRKPLDDAVAYTIRSQHSQTGGWRYRPGDEGDTSQFGWQLMALMSARSAGLEIPESTLDGMQRWLERVSSGKHGGLASYLPHQQPTYSMTAEAMVCRMFLDRPFDPRAIEEAADRIAEYGVDPRNYSLRHPNVEVDQRLNLYYVYYATMGLFQLQGERWESWNTELQQTLLPRQKKTGSLAGSWDPETVWGANGGRVYSTALAALCLESYYRYLPFYRPPEEMRTASGRWFSR